MSGLLDHPRGRPALVRGDVRADTVSRSPIGSIFHDMFKRAFTHVHDTNEGDDVSFRFYVWQLGYALFPWTGLAPAGLRVVDSPPRRRRRAARVTSSVFLVMWFVFAFALFTFMRHEVPPLHLPGGPARGDAHGHRARSTCSAARAARASAGSRSCATALPGGLGLSALVTVYGSSHLPRVDQRLPRRRPVHACGPASMIARHSAASWAAIAGGGRHCRKFGRRRRRSAATRPSNDARRARTKI